MRITESRLRSIIRSVILESNSALEYTYTLSGSYDDHDIDHDELIDFLTGIDIPEDLLKYLDSDPSFLNSVMKKGNFEDRSDFVYDYEANKDGRWDNVTGLWAKDFEDIAIAISIENAEDEIYNSDKDDV